MVTPSSGIHQFHQAVDEVKQSLEQGQKKYIKIDKWGVSTTSKKSEKAPFKEIAKLITGLKEDALKNPNDFDEFAQTVDQFKKMAKSQSDLGTFLRNIFGPSEAERSMQKFNLDVEEQDFMNKLLAKPDKTDEDFRFIMDHSKIRFWALTYLKQSHQDRVDRAIMQYGLTVPEAIALAVYTTDAYKLLNAYLRKQDDVFLNEFQRVNLWLQDPYVNPEYEDRVKAKPKAATGNITEIDKVYRAEAQVITDLVSSGLKKLPAYQGSLYRGDILTEEEYQRMLSKEYYDLTFLSFSTDKNIGTEFLDRSPTNIYEKYKVFIEVVNSKTGHDMSLLSNTPREAEATVDKGQKFDVIKIKNEQIQTKRGQTLDIIHITLQEKKYG